MALTEKDYVDSLDFVSASIACTGANHSGGAKPIDAMLTAFLYRCVGSVPA